MLGNFVYYNPTKLYFGQDSLKYLNDELKNYGKKVMLVYGKGSIKKIGLYDEVVKILKDNGKEIFEDPGVMPNPTLEKVYDGCRIARENNVDLILAVGGGSVCDYSKAVSVSAYCEEDPWEKYYIRMEEVNNKIIPIGCILTMTGTGSEMNGGSVITNTETKQKIGRVFGPEVFPKFSILNPLYTYSVPKYQMVAGIFDIMSHLLEQYFSGEDDNTTDYIIEGLLRSLIHSSKVAVKNPEDYEARSNIMWTATWALNTLVAKGKTEDWMVHMIGHAISAYTDATHGMTLAAVSIPYYRYIMPYGLKKFKRYAINVWNVNPEGKTDEEIAKEGLDRMEEYMREIGLVMNIRDLGVTEDMFEGIAKSTFILDGGYKVLSREEIIKILKDCM
ncbi:NADH-dependent butanol dehydrogenase A [Thermoclostridium stercorarium subsp. stercorarium DSM 8532]|jgi:alcohol dehydrogenase YqhD (iron-dependent ADH family)|uniref:NADH-dependent butanol dehydrogenase A n=3 Tax=Thermoclostridium stercorarium TaxID=1510 RepID=L7VLV9_THES1|nr:iron-containing alcohol dehydrogenase [Thermoclostridium stercorarium]AGC67707.1 NADH-dependent butanol dehydrogenase A [Thermoclostridium stercorarium subsp. stercorarium DSM 8532]AGI38752.1 Adh [Thermoclostridium stercorarium subsp. stercorarium DSM 8532]ANW98120.1 butanol dehydrogenase [Thermoclostridium stercorarium subsp. thermolacticum DSM 2910]ANX00664.1 butanol dehydrogenase [Thermoclostridium stercorarium subsp. leptospartum DSM 9219]UZQ86278.1 iron-containing alcohol dehydrogenase